MSATEYYSHTTYPATGAAGSSASLRSELELVEAGFGKLPDLSGNGSKIVAVNSGGTALEAVTSLTVAQGGTGRVTSTTAYALLAAGTTATGAHQTLAAGATTEILVGGGASALPVWTTATGTGAPVRADSPTLITPALGTPSALVGTNITGTAASLTAGNVTTNANLTGHITSVGNAAVLGSFTFAQLNTAVSDAEVARTDAANTFTGTQTFSNLIAAAAGSVGAPSIYMTGYATTGWYNIGANNWGFAVSGAKVLDVASTGLSVTGAIISTSASLHALSPLGAQAATRLYLSSADQTSATNGLIVGDSAGNNALQVKGDRSVVLGASIATVSSTGLAVTGKISATGDVTASGGNLLLSSGGTIPLRISGATTGSSIARIQNTGGVAIFGQEDSAGNALIVGCSAYDTIVRGSSGIAFSANAGAGMQMRLSSTGLAVTGALSATGTLSTIGLITSTAAAQSALFNNAVGSYATWQYGGTSVGDVGTANQAVSGGSTADFAITSRAGNLILGSGTTTRVTVSSVGIAVTGEISATGDVTASGGNVLGTREILQNSKSAAYTTVLGDAGKHILHPSADTTARTFTIDSNANVAYPVGTAITFVNQASAGVMTISITSDTMRLAGAGTTGSRTLAANGIATALKITTTEWIISGTGLT